MALLLSLRPVSLLPGDCWRPCSGQVGGDGTRSTSGTDKLGKRNRECRKEKRPVVSRNRVITIYNIHHKLALALIPVQVTVRLPLTWYIINVPSFAKYQNSLNPYEKNAPPHLKISSSSITVQQIEHESTHFLVFCKRFIAILFESRVFLNPQISARNVTRQCRVPPSPWHSSHRPRASWAL